MKRHPKITRKEMIDTVFGCCKNCGKEFNSELRYEYEIRYCPWCGTEIKQEEDDE